MLLAVTAAYMTLLLTSYAAYSHSLLLCMRTVLPICNVLQRRATLHNKHYDQALLLCLLYMDGSMVSALT